MLGLGKHGKHEGKHASLMLPCILPLRKGKHGKHEGSTREACFPAQARKREAREARVYIDRASMLPSERLFGAFQGDLTEREARPETTPWKKRPR